MYGAKFSLIKANGTAEERVTGHRESASEPNFFEDFIPGITGFTEAVGSASKMSKSELSKLSPTMMSVVAQMKLAVADAKAKIATDGTGSSEFLRQLIESAEGVISMAENLAVVGPTGETSKSTRVDDRSAATDLIKLVHLGGGAEGPGVIWRLAHGQGKTFGQ
jgi:hypothetical protein